MRPFGLIISLLLIWSSPAATGQEQTITIGTVSGQLKNAAQMSFAPFTNYLNEKIPDAKFQMRAFNTIGELIEAVNQKQLDFAFITPAAFVELNIRHDLRPVATITQLSNGKAYPWLAGAVFTKKSNTGINNLNDVAGNRVVALSERALGGWLSAVREWRELSIDVKEDAASVDFVFSYAAVIDAVCTGKADIGVIAAGVFSLHSQNCPLELKVIPNLRIAPDPKYPLSRSTRIYPEVAFTALSNLDERLITRVTRELLAIKTGSDIARSVNVAGFTAPLSYTPVVDLMQELGLGPYKTIDQLTLLDFLKQNALVVIATLSVFIAILILTLFRSWYLNKQLDRARQYRERVFHGSHLSTIIIEPESGKIQELNNAAVALFGFKDADEALGKTLIELSAPEQDDGSPVETGIRNYLNKTLAEGHVTYEWKHVRPDGGVWEGQVYLMSFDSVKGRLIQYTVEDVTERKKAEAERARLEQQLQHSQQMESIGRMAGAIAHDFNNLLTVINGRIHLLLVNSNTNTKFKEDLDQIWQAGKRATELTSQLLTFGRRQVSKTIPLNINNLLKESETMFHSILGEEIRFEVSVNQALGEVFADPVEIHQVLMNMIVNAKAAMPDGGVLKITTDNIYLEQKRADSRGVRPGSYVEIRISDTGCGIESDIQDRIFEPFFSTKGESGTGLGLATVYGIVKNLKGTINVVSEKDKGTTFIIYIPHTSKILQQQPEGEKTAVDGTGVKGAKQETVLVVEDQDDVRLYVTTVLKKAGYNVIEAASGNEALALMRSHEEHIDLLLTDVVVRGFNGRELSERFIRDFPDARILFTSGYPDDEIAKRGVLFGSVDFLPKPYLPQDVLGKIREVLDNNR